MGWQLRLTLLQRDGPLLSQYLAIHPPQQPSTTHLLYHFLPIIWSSFLRYSSPLFTVLEGISSLLVIQALGRTTRSWIEEGERVGKDIRGVVTLVGASSIYVFSVFALVKVRSPILIDLIALLASS